MRKIFTFLMLLTAVSLSAQVTNPKIDVSAQDTAQSNTTNISHQTGSSAEPEKPAQQNAQTAVATTPTITIKAHGDAATIVNRYLRIGNKKVKAYRIMIFMGNSADAREKASSERARFNKLYPKQPTHMFYENPYFKVTAGNFRTKEEAEKMLNHVRKTFPTAIIIQKTVPITVFAK